MTALWIILALTVGAIAGALWRREKTADAEFLRDEAEIAATYWHEQAQRALPTDKWIESGGDLLMRAIGLTPVDPDSDALWAKFDEAER